MEVDTLHTYSEAVVSDCRYGPFDATFVVLGLALHITLVTPHVAPQITRWPITAPPRSFTLA